MSRATIKRSTPTPDLVWRAQISGLLRDLTAEVVALTEVVMKMAEKLEAQEAQSQEDRP